MTHSFTLREFGFEESYFIDFVISSRYPKTLATSTSREDCPTLHDPLLTCMRDIGVSESRLTSGEYIGNYIQTPVRDRDIRGEYGTLMYSNTCSLAARGDELERDRSDIARLPVAESDRVEFEHMIFWLFSLIFPDSVFFPDAVSFVDGECRDDCQFSESDEIISIFCIGSSREIPDIAEIDTLDTASRHIIAVVTGVGYGIIFFSSIFEIFVSPIELIDPVGIGFPFCYEILYQVSRYRSTAIGIDIVSCGAYESKVECTRHIVTLR